MRRSKATTYLLLVTLLLCVSNSLVAQKTSDPQPQLDVVRISTDLVQTDLAVFDEKGGFVVGLSPDQIQLRVNGKPRQVLSVDLAGW